MNGFSSDGLFEAEETAQSTFTYVGLTLTLKLKIHLQICTGFSKLSSTIRLSKYS